MTITLHSDTSKQIMPLTVDDIDMGATFVFTTNPDGVFHQGPLTLDKIFLCTDEQSLVNLEGLQLKRNQRRYRPIKLVTITATAEFKT